MIETKARVLVKQFLKCTKNFKFQQPKFRVEINLSYSRRTFTKTVKRDAVLRTLSFDHLRKLCISDRKILIGNSFLCFTVLINHLCYSDKTAFSDSIQSQ